MLAHLGPPRIAGARLNPVYAAARNGTVEVGFHSHQVVVPAEEW